MILEKLSDYFSNWDPMGFIVEGAPGSEYEPEAVEIIKRFNSNMSKDELSKLVYDIFVDFFEINPDNFKDECFERALSIRNILDEGSRKV